jgi:riboflavin synthase
LTIHYSNTSTDVQTACNSYTWIDGNTYTTSNNTATDTLINADGCDSVVTLNLTIHYSNTGTDVQTACNSYTWLDGNTYSTSNNTATDTLINADGCDSVVTLNLTIHYSNTGTDVQTGCNSFTWIDGNTYTTSTTTATDTLTNAAGCDSVVTLHLTINSVSDLSTTTSGLAISANNANATYQWLDCNNAYAIINGQTGQTFTATANGNYAVELTENGCVDTSACVAITTVGIVENSFGDGLFIYPNPTKGNFSIDLGALYENAQVSITDISGKLVESKSIAQSQVLNLTIEEPAGIYLISIQAGNKKAVIKLVKE